MSNVSLWKLTALAAVLALVSCRGGDGPAKAPGPEGAAQPKATRGPTPEPALVDDFRTLDRDRWVVTKLNDFEQVSVDLVPDPKEPGDKMLRFQMSTMKTDPSTVKFVGVAHPKPLDLSTPVRIAVDFDWGDQTNGSYLTLGLFLSPEWTTGAVTRTMDWLGFRLVGVPPGKQVRQEIMRRNYGNLQEVERFGWPDKKDFARLGRVRLELELDGRRLVARMDGAEIFRTEDAGIRFDKAYLYVEASSHSNYPVRNLYVDEIEIAGKILDEPAVAPGRSAAAKPTNRDPAAGGAPEQSEGGGEKPATGARPSAGGKKETAPARPVGSGQDLHAR